MAVRNLLAIRSMLAILFFSLISAIAWADAFTVQYKPVATLASSDKIEAEIRITNTSSQSVNLATTSIQYYFTKEGTAAMTGTSDYAAVLGNNYRDVTSSVRVAFDTTKINISFVAAAGTLAAGQTLHVQFRANAINWFKQTQSNDPSFNGAITSFTNVTSITVNGGATTPVALKGSIKNTTGGVIAGAKIKYPGGEATSAADGSFSATANLSGATAITVSAAGYADVSRIYSPVAGKIAINANLLAIDKTQIISPNVANTVTTPGGASVTFPPMFDITEQLSVSLTQIRANTRDLESASGDFSALTSNGSQVQLISQGMLDVVVKGVQTGQIYSLANKGSFKIKIPASFPSTAPATIPMWYYNTATGKWMEEGTATLTNGMYVGDVTHFTTWNMDIPGCGGSNVACGCVNVTVNDPGNPGFNTADLYTVRIKGLGWNKSMVGVTAEQLKTNLIFNLLPPGTVSVQVTNTTSFTKGDVSTTVTSGAICANANLALASPSVAGLVSNACNASPVSDAKIDILDRTNQLAATTTTDSTGSYFFPAVSMVPDLGYSVKISSPSFITATINNVIIADSKALILSNALDVPNDGVTGTLTGSVLRAENGSALANAAYQIRSGINNSSGAVVASGTTDTNGKYSLTLPLGNYSIKASTAEGAGTANGESTACAKAAPNIVVSSPFAGVRIIMSWNLSATSDLDSYLKGPDFLINFTKKTFGTVASLNIDARNTNSVEVVTLSEEGSGSTYTYAVHDFANQNNAASQALSRSGASVTVVRNGVVTDIFNVPANKSGTLWKVFSMVNGVITPINTVSTQAPGSL